MEQLLNLDIHPAVLLAVSLWTLLWKGLALWKAAQKGRRNWFIALLVINSLGIFEIAYIYFIDKKLDKTILADKSIDNLNKETK